MLLQVACVVNRDQTSKTDSIFFFLFLPVVTVRTCSIAGVFRAEGNERHSLDFDMAKQVCEQQMSTIATLEQVEEAYNAKFKTCRCINKHFSKNVYLYSRLRAKLL